MGTINYGSNKYVTMGLNLDYFDDLDDLDREYEQEFMYEEIKEILEKYYFNYWIVSIEPGYYEGFYIKIKNDWLYFYDSYERNDVLKETTQLKKFLLECLTCGLVVVYPGWCTSYLDQDRSKKHILEAIRGMKNDIKQKPTWNQFEKRA